MKHSLSLSLVAKSYLTLATPWAVACQAPLSMGFSRQEYWSGLPFSFPGDLSNQRIEALSLASPALEGRFFTTSTTWSTSYGHWQNEYGMDDNGRIL